MKRRETNMMYDFSDKGQVVEIIITEEPIGILANVRFTYGSNVLGFWNESNFRKAIMANCDGYTWWKDNRIPQ